MESPKVMSARLPAKTVTTFITRADLFWVGMRVGARSRLLQLVPLIYFCLTLWDQWHSENRPKYWLHATLTVGFDAAIFCGFWTILVAMVGALTAWKATKGSGVLGTHHYEIREDGLFEATDVNETLTKWSGIYRAMRNRSNLLICENRKHYHVIPIRAFTDVLAANAFFDELLERVKRS